MVRRRRILRVALPLACLGAVLVSWTGAANGALVQVGNIQLKANGGFRPQRLPRNHYAPIEFQGYAEIHSVTGGPPPELTEAIIEFDRDGRLDTKGLPICAAERIADLGTAAARKTCEGAIVGTGTVGATVFFDGVSAPVHAPLTLFNGPVSEGNATVNAHVHIASPVNQTFVVPVTLERVSGEYSYRASFDAPSLAGGGVLTHVDAKIGRMFKSGGRERSYVSARCQDGILRTHGHFVFADGTIIDGAIEKACVPY
jgi:hypothetical protein